MHKGSDSRSEVRTFNFGYEDPSNHNTVSTASNPPSSYEYIGGEYDAFIVSSPQGAFRLQRQTLKSTLQELRDYAPTQVRALTGTAEASFHSVVEALRMLYGSPALYDIVLTDVEETFRGIDDTIPGSVGAFFRGCFPAPTENAGDVPLGCNPTCASSLPPPDGTPGYSSCEDLVLVYKNNEFQALNEKRSSHCYIYVTADSFTNFRAEDIKKLQDNQIQEATLIIGNTDGSYREVRAPVPVNQLPTNSIEQTPAPSSSNIGAVVAIVIVLALAVFLLYLYYRDKFTNVF